MNPLIRFFRSKIYTAIWLLVILLLIGIVGFKFMLDVSWVDALYMTVITVSTVGFKEAQPLDDITSRNTIKEKKLLSYQPIHERDILWEKCQPRYFAKENFDLYFPKRGKYAQINNISDTRSRKKYVEKFLITWLIRVNLLEKISMLTYYLALQISTCKKHSCM